MVPSRCWVRAHCRHHGMRIAQSLSHGNWFYLQVPRKTSFFRDQISRKETSNSAASLLRWQIGTRHIWVVCVGKWISLFWTIWRSPLGRTEVSGTVWWQTICWWSSCETHSVWHPLSGDLASEMAPWWDGPRNGPMMCPSPRRPFLEFGQSQLQNWKLVSETCVSRENSKVSQKQMLSVVQQGILSKAQRAILQTWCGE